MPELPEVETVTVHLARLVTGRTIIAADLIRERLAPHMTAQSFGSSLANALIERIHRRGKHILFRLDNGKTLIVHLRMSGRFMLIDEAETEPKFTHARFLLDSGDKLLFQDQRHFGYMRVAETGELATSKELSRLAPEPFTDDFSPEYLLATAKRSSRPIKEILLDQTKVCGVGNIYASESLFLSGISPRLRGHKLTKPKAAALHGSIRDVLSETVELGAATALDPRNIAGGIYGDSDPNWRVYGREGKPCPNCGSPIKRVVQAGRSTFFCRRCQR
jgi:formamidopyrimidine-DNA glycosylase